MMAALTPASHSARTAFLPMNQFMCGCTASEGADSPTVPSSHAATTFTR